MKRKKQLLLSGNEAVAYGAYDAGVKVATSYPGTPATEILQTLFQFKQVKTQWSVNEKVAFEVAYGAAVGGVRSLYVSKHVGLNVAMDPLMSASYTGVNAGFVIVVGDDPGIHSSQNEQDTRWIARYAKIPLLEPADGEDAYNFIKEAFTISERFDTPVLVRLTTRVCHSKESMFVGKRSEVPRREFKRNPEKFVMLPGYANKRHDIVEKRMVRLAKFAETTKLNISASGSPKDAIVTSGVTYCYAKELYPKSSFLKLGLTYPLCKNKIIKFCEDNKSVTLLEELDPILETEIKALGINIKSKDSSFITGELLPEDILKVRSNEKRIRKKFDIDKPSFCKGCSHAFVFDVIHEMDLDVTGDIGCYTLGVFEPYNAIHTVLCMGAGITIHEGFKLASRKKRTVGVIGDSTFLHSGMTGLLNAVNSGIHGVIIILDNASTAMTGGQPHAAGGDDPVVDIAAICSALGVKNVDVLKPQKKEKLKNLLTDRLNENALSVIIAKSPCILQVGKKRKVNG